MWCSMPVRHLHGGEWLFRALRVWSFLWQEGAVGLSFAATKGALNRGFEIAKKIYAIRSIRRDDGSSGPTWQNAKALP